MKAIMLRTQDLAAAFAGRHIVMLQPAEWETDEVIDWDADALHADRKYLATDVTMWLVVLEDEEEVDDGR